MKNWILFLTTIFVQKGFAQSDSAKQLNYSAYGEVYYSYDFSKPSNHTKSDFLYNHKRHNELNFNLLLVKANYVDKNYRANLGVMAGNYAQYNLSTEPDWAQFIYEANAGIKLSKTKNIWLDAGIFPSHIGFESAITADCWTLTRSLLAENSPYYESGLKLTYTTKNEQLLLSAMLLNGWQKIQKPDFVQRPSFGMQANYKPSSKISFNYSNFIGSDKPDSLKSLRHFHNIYFQYEPTSNFGIIVGFDFGFEKTRFTKFKTWHTPVLIIKQSVSKKSNLVLRAEYYSDPNQIIITTGTANGFRTSGLSATFDCNLFENIELKCEGKTYHSKNKIFANNTSHNNYSLTTSLCIKL